jgi:hypothetical protein
VSDTDAGDGAAVCAAIHNAARELGALVSGTTTEQQLVPFPSSGWGTLCPHELFLLHTSVSISEGNGHKSSRFGQFLDRKQITAIGLISL